MLKSGIPDMILVIYPLNNYFKVEKLKFGCNKCPFGPKFQRYEYIIYQLRMQMLFFMCPNAIL